MREIKFRVWDGYKIHYPTVVEIGICGVNSLTSASFQSGNGGYITSAYVMQFTGLHDKNGVEIYEGDVIKYEGYDGTIDHAEVCWHQGFLAWMVDDHSGRGMISLCDLTTDKIFDDDTNQFNCDELAVIGNIHENPELLESPDA